MPDEQGKPLPPLESEAFDGYKEEASIHRDLPLEKHCKHKDIKLISGTQLLCGCGVGFQGTNILTLYKALHG